MMLTLASVLSFKLARTASVGLLQFTSVFCIHTFRVCALVSYIILKENCEKPCLLCERYTLYVSTRQRQLCSLTLTWQKVKMRIRQSILCIVPCVSRLMHGVHVSRSQKKKKLVGCIKSKFLLCFYSEIIASCSIKSMSSPLSYKKCQSVSSLLDSRWFSFFYLLSFCCNFRWRLSTY